jgi:hypothetical protein
VRRTITRDPIRGAIGAIWQHARGIEAARESPPPARSQENAAAIPVR